jgi:hypothetical protein
MYVVDVYKRFRPKVLDGSGQKCWMVPAKSAGTDGIRVSILFFA